MSLSGAVVITRPQPGGLLFILNIIKVVASLSFETIFRCQTYEGGFGGCPGMEAHGGYSFCGVAALTLLNKTKLCDIDAVLVSSWKSLLFQSLEIVG